MSLRSLAAAATLLACACSASPASFSSADDLTGVSGRERPITFQSFVYVDPAASDADIQTAIARQVKTALGALRSTKVALDDRGAAHNLDPSGWKRVNVDVVDPSSHAKTGSLLKVSFTYSDKAVVTHDLDGRSAVAFTLLAGDYALHAADLKATCSDDPTTDTDSLWYHFDPTSASCQAKIGSELDAIKTERTSIGATSQVGPTEAARWFLPVTAALGSAKDPGKDYSPEYDRLYGLGTDKSQLVVYAFFGVDSDETNPDDVLAQEWVRFLRTLLAAEPNFRVTKTDPFAYLQDVYVDGKKLGGVTYDLMFQWILDQTGYPAAVGSDAGKIQALRKAALANLTERWIYWDLPISVGDSAHGSKNMTVQVRTYFGYEDGSDVARQHAEWRYLEAFWYGDVFVYNGHSHFGHGPLEPNLYGPQNFNDRYQIMMVNSCLSYNYYHEDFFGYKPGGTKNLDMIVNGLPSYVWGGGAVTARLVAGLVSGSEPTYKELITQMELDTPWGETGYDPMRVADGELDNVYSRAADSITITPLAPVY